GNDRRRLHFDEADIAEAGNGEAPDLRQLDAPEHLHLAHAASHRRLDLALGYGLESAAENLGREGAIDEADDQHAGDEIVDIAPLTRGGNGAEDVLQQHRAAIIDQQQQDQFRNTADDDGIGVGEAPRETVLRKLAGRADQPQHDREKKRADGDLDRRDNTLDEE